MIDREPDGVKIFQDMMIRLNIVAILGNHKFTAAVCLPELLKEITKQSLSDLNKTCLEGHSRVAHQRRWANAAGTA